MLSQIRKTVNLSPSKSKVLGSLLFQYFSQHPKSPTQPNRSISSLSFDSFYSSSQNIFPHRPPICLNDNNLHQNSTSSTSSNTHHNSSYGHSSTYLKNPFNFKSNQTKKSSSVIFGKEQFPKKLSKQQSVKQQVERSSSLFSSFQNTSSSHPVQKKSYSTAPTATTWKRGFSSSSSAATGYKMVADQDIYAPDLKIEKPDQDHREYKYL